MSELEALILGLVQGLTEYLPVSSSGHLAIGSALFGIESEENLAFTILVHVATVLSTLVVLGKEIGWILKGLFKFEMNPETRYTLNILVSMIPIGIVGVFFKDSVEAIFGSGLAIVGAMLLLTALLLAFSYYAKPRQKEELVEGCFYHRFGASLCCDAGPFPLGHYHCHGPFVGQQERELGTVLLLDGYPTDIGRGVAGRIEDDEGRSLGGRYGDLLIGSRLLGCFPFRMCGL